MFVLENFYPFILLLYKQTFTFAASFSFSLTCLW